MGLPTSEEKVQLAQFRERLSNVLENDPELNSDMYLIRWIRARNHNLDLAEKMIRTSLEWRRANNVDEILREMPDSYFTTGFPYFLNGTDKKGQPVVCIPVGEWNLKKCIEDGKVGEFSKYTNRLFERVNETIRVCNSKKNSQTIPVTQFTLIMNFYNFSMMQMTSLQAIQSMLRFALVYESHYPEILDKAFFINTNAVFQALFLIMKPLLAERTLGKITCFGVNRNEWEPVIREVVEKTQIPTQFGG